MDSVYQTSLPDCSIREIAELRIAQISAILNLAPGYFETSSDALQTALDAISNAVDRLKTRDLNEQ